MRILEVCPQRLHKLRHLGTGQGSVREPMAHPQDCQLLLGKEAHRRLERPGGRICDQEEEGRHSYLSVYASIFLCWEPDEPDGGGVNDASDAELEEASADEPPDAPELGPCARAWCNR